MSRHRNIRSMNYSEECDGYDDVYGHSVEDDYCISPSDAAQFMYNREGRNRSMGAFFNTEGTIAEGDENETPRPKENAEGDIDKAKLESCVESIKKVVGDSVSHKTLVDTIINYNFNTEKALDSLLTHMTDKNLSTKTSKVEVPVRSVKIVPQTLNVTKGFELPRPDKDVSRPNALTPRSQSPASGTATPLEGRATPDIQKTKDSKIDPLALYQKEREGEKSHLYMIIIGHVDAGKSTLMGHLLYDLGQINQRTMHKYETESRKLGKQSFLYAWVLDETGEERERGITMDIGRSQFETKTKKITLLDAPGHKDFIPNMISGAGQADVALLVVDATKGEFETGFDLGGQTREHALLVRSLGVGQLAVAINKFDNVDWDKKRFDEIKNSLGSFLRQAGFRDKDVTYVPVSGLTGQNLVGPPTENALLQWYNGPCLLDVIDKFSVPERAVSKPFRFSIHDIYKGTGAGLCVSGRIETGVLNVGDRVLLCPVKEGATVRNITLDEVPMQTAFAGDQVSITLTGIDIQNITIGCILSTPISPVPVVQKFEARIVVFNVKTPLTRGYPVLLHHQSLIEAANITKIKAQLHKSTGEVIKKKPRCLGSYSNAIVEIVVNKPICIELFRDVKELGRFMLRVAGTTVAAGLVTELLE
ncbi:HBS1-like protein isoform X2 [Chrysoperla carnea]|uniref:HBS1-like protein isoform X2 n=1 Tax=Chrysoperla carnea TaxID=189513 RepID=UPI001D07B030|nr:HBS1-like protein isoform X2 [Chrysoperla carnea]